ncbi:DUF2325 domain-containing protein [Bordetella bronchiseptica]|uniref:DUF2325 domain-containing protein n=1 Tax=Bordetella bronchiseptica TaxID=518 RepID=UPI0002EF55D3|nr:DUF2325 domain-containing protein [Bordetella bronchiseptica]KDC17377.1 PF10087 family protein [Bordetella bronchiseptica F-1]KDC32797.1 PF10087 family protein [Bordetella bronchiseptica F2]KDC67259.1 PF10087 family protein [Bordetella bronchiseptica MBORD591]
MPHIPLQYDLLQQEYAALLSQYGRAQTRCSRLLSRHAEQIAQLRQELMVLRGALVAQTSALAWAREDRAALEASLPGLPRRRVLARRLDFLMERVQSLLRARSGGTPGPALMVDASAKSVLCVGAGGAAARAARAAIERAGGRFLHHDGEVGDAAGLEASLVSADLVICQTGCVSHGAYWRVQDHCKRTGKQCVLVEQPAALNIVRVRRPADAPQD